MSAWYREGLHSPVPRHILAAIVVLAGCHGHTGESGTGESDSPVIDTDDTDDSDDTEVTAFPGFEVVEQDQTTFAGIGYELVRYEITDDAADPYSTIFDTNPVFLVLRPIEVEPDEKLPLLVWFHGGALGNDASSVPPPCTEAESIALSAVAEDMLIPHFMANRRWALAMPINEWCDGWHGLGPADPVDPVNHYGYYHADRVLDFLLSGEAGFEPSGDLYGWGTSAGGAAAILNSAWYGGFDGLIADSSPCDMLEYFEQDPSGISHVLGGPPYDDFGEPTAEYDRYVAHSCNDLVGAGGLRVPMYVTYNTQDQLVPTTHPLNLGAALTSSYGDEGIRYGIHNFDHASPGAVYHVQTRMVREPMGYTTELMLRFLEGDALLWQEAEQDCSGDCAAGAVVSSTDTPPIVDMSMASGRVATTAGQVFSAPVPEGLPSGKSITVTGLFVLQDFSVEASTPVATLRYSEGGDTQQKILVAGDFAPSNPNPMTQGTKMVEQYRATNLVFEASDPANGVLSLESAGVGTLYVDGFVYAWAP